MVLTRENIRDGWVQRMVAASGDLRPLSEAELQESRRAILARHPAGQDLWVFGYGSLIWNPCFHFVERRVGRVHGYHRRFCLWTHGGRGTRERPGLMLGLERGGTCRGVAFRIAGSEIETELDIVWRREMVTGAYAPTWVGVTLDDGREIRAIAFVINHRHERYAKRLSDTEIVEAVATARGPLGACCDYLFNTTAHLEELGIADRNLRRLCRAVQRYQAEGAFGAPTATAAPRASEPPA